MTFHLTIVTPEKTLVDVEVEQLLVPTTTGELTILPHHVPLFTQIAEGELVYTHNGRPEHMIIAGGFVEVGVKSTTILADYAVLGKDISAAEAEKAKERAEKAMKEKRNAQDFAQAEAEFKRAIAELKVANKYRKIQR